MVLSLFLGMLRNAFRRSSVDDTGVCEKNAPRHKGRYIEICALTRKVRIGTPIAIYRSSCRRAFFRRHRYGPLALLSDKLRRAPLEHLLENAAPSMLPDMLRNAFRSTTLDTILSLLWGMLRLRSTIFEDIIFRCREECSGIHFGAALSSIRHSASSLSTGIL